ncbi:hypothetical protein ECARS42123_4900 [Escherichia coli ARS4.2123]|nr:hypothetical protein ECARS42123_4900 [Escherichia coli ARS4.2123]
MIQSLLIYLLIVLVDDFSFLDCTRMFAYLEINTSITPQ